MFNTPKSNLDKKIEELEQQLTLYKQVAELKRELALEHAIQEEFRMIVKVTIEFLKNKTLQANPNESEVKN
ncbi:hypothetical protein KFD70_19160 [Bacillus pfraonensis]|uniref:hypothetical protein n=1 Tax=Bacillus TaxID=1386 RepID=UPI003012B109